MAGRSDEEAALLIERMRNSFRRLIDIETSAGVDTDELNRTVRTGTPLSTRRDAMLRVLGCKS